MPEEANLTGLNRLDETKVKPQIVLFQGHADLIKARREVYDLAMGCEELCTGSEVWPDVSFLIEYLKSTALKKFKYTSSILENGEIQVSG